MLAETAEAANGIAKRKQIVHNFNNSHFATAFGGISKLKGSPGNVTMAVWGVGGGQDIRRQDARERRPDCGTRRLGRLLSLLCHCGFLFYHDWDNLLADFHFSAALKYAPRDVAQTNATATCRKQRA